MAQKRLGRVYSHMLYLKHVIGVLFKKCCLHFPPLPLLEIRPEISCPVSDDDSLTVFS